MKKKILILLAALILVLSLSAISVSAANIAEGTCSNGHTWYINESGTLKITGTGPMADYTLSNPAPWREHYLSIKQVVMSNSITHIGDYAFYELASVTKVTMPSSLESIGQYAFYRWVALPELTIPSKVTSIGKYAFCSTTALEKIYWNAENVSDFTKSNYVFYKTGELSGNLEVIFGSSAKSIPAYAFQPKEFSSSSYSYIKKLTIGENVTSVGDYAFCYSTSLTSIATGDGVEIIGDHAFAGCTGVKTITLGKNVKEIKSLAFNYCPSLEKIIWGAESANSMTDMGVFRNSGVKTGVDVVFTSTVKNIPVCALASGLFKVKSIVIEENVESIGASAFSGTGVTEVTFPSSLKSIGGGAFSTVLGKYDSSVKNVYISDLASWCSISFGHKSASPFCGSGANLYVNGELTAKLVIPLGVEKISDYAFYGCGSITSVVMKGTVKSVGMYAFYGCPALAEVNTGSGVEETGDYAFSACPSLTRVTFGNKVKNIGAYSFAESASLKYATLPASLEKIGDYAFYKCSALKSVEFPEKLASIGEYAYSNSGISGDLVFKYPVSIGDYAFINCDKIESVTVGIADTSIGVGSFNGCDGLKTLTVEKNVTSIGKYAFYLSFGLEKVYWNAEKITDLESNYYILNGAGKNSEGVEVVFGENISSAPKFLFASTSASYSGKISKITFLSGSGTIGGASFSLCSFPKGLELGEDVSVVGPSAFKETVFGGPLKITSENITINAQAFMDAQLTELIWSSENGTLPATGLTEVFRDAVIDKVTISDGIEKIPAYLLYDAKSIGEIVVGKDVKIVEKYAFNQIENIGKVIWNSDNTESVATTAFKLSKGNLQIEFGENVKTVPAGLFNGCVFDSITISGSFETIGEMAFVGANLKTIVIPDSVKTIGNSAFRNCTALESIYFGSNPVNIGENAFDGCKNLKEVHVADIAAWCESNFVLQGNPLCYGAGLYVNGALVTELVVPDSVTYIGKYTFWNYDLLTKVEIGNGVTEIGEYAFASCSLLGEITLGNSLTKIGNNTFEYTPVVSITIPEKVTEIGYCAFGDCASLENVKFLNDNLSVGYGVFHGCTALKEITLPKNMEVVGESMFGGSTSLEKVNLPENLVKIDKSAFYECTSIENITIPGTVKEIGSDAFYGCSGLKEISIPASVETIGYGAFSNCTGLKEVIVPNSVAELGSRAFYGCTSLEKAVLGNGLANIEKGKYGWFYGCTALKEVVLPDNLPYIPSSCFYGCKVLENVVLGKDAAYIGSAAFGGCSQLKSITIGNKVSLIYLAAFEDCERLADVYFLGDSWSGIEIESRNDDLLTATVHYATTVRFDGNGADSGGVSAFVGETGSVITIPENGYYKRGHDFKGWSCAGKIYQPGDSYTVKENAVFYALWQKTVTDGSLSRVILDYDGYYRYYVNGEIQAGWQVANNGYKYYFSASATKYGAAITGENVKIGSEYYDFDEEGRLIEDYDENGEAVLYYDESQDIRITIAYNLNGGDTLYGEKTLKIYPGDEPDLTVKAEKKGYIFRGWNSWKYDKVPIDWYYPVSENTVLYAVFTRNTNWEIILEDDGYYRYYIDGFRQVKWQVTPEGYKYYFSTSAAKYGAAMTGKRVKIGGTYYDFTEDGKLIDHYDSDGNPVLYTERNGFVTDSSGVTRYYVDDEYLIGWQYIDGNKYYFSKSNGKMLSGMTKIGSITYNLGTDGAWVGYSNVGYTEEECPASPLMSKDDDGEYRYYINDKPYTGWKVLLGEDGYYKYYFSKADGAAKTDYAIQVGSQVYDFTATGALISVEKDENGNAVMEIYKLSFEQGAKNGLVLDDDGEYRFYIDGEFQSGWVTVNGSRYLFRKADGSAITSDDHQSEKGYRYGSYYYIFTDDGKLVSRSAK